MVPAHTQDGGRWEVKRYLNKHISESAIRGIKHHCGIKVCLKCQVL